ncbi:unnamed protein product [Rotaria socialis]|uniref:Uncharacterized protein n=1 Tax=Rotaria socialis TaxID=392032 RepID=A0A820UPB4_9BILA|nr:unnamed protein product [Rotaria socialis]CAF3315200.1 unnamed protein product [Rotaria socialis]CAF4488238.1 unnamed protein product [Rotaria socialis]CAF4783401.1 unnamed protein product [Rotaria socialis]
MFYPTTEYAYIDENGQTVEPSRFTQHVYPDSSEPAASHLILDENSPDNNQQQIQYRPIVIDGSQPLAKCSVLYLGTAISSPGQRGIDAIQEPLSRRYPVDGKEVVRGIEAWLSIYDNGLQLQFARDPSVVLFYPIRSLVYCASIRFATRTQTGAEFPNGWRFVPLDSPAAARVENTRNPPLFAVTFRRTRHLPVDECHSFVTKTRQAALALVQACFSAYQATTSQQDCSKVPLYFKVDDYGSKNQEIDNEIRIVPAPDRERTLDYQTNKEGAGFYYKTDRVPIDTWQLWEHHKHDVDRSTKKSYHSTSRSLSCSSSHSRGSSSLASCSSSSSSCSSCQHNRRSRRRHRRRRRLASIASISAAQQQQQQQQFFPPSESQTVSINTVPSSMTTASAQQTAQSSVDPYAPAPNLIRVERIKDVNTGQDVFIRWVSDATATTGTHDDQQISVPQQVYSTQPPNSSTINYDYQIDRDVPNEIERLTLHDEHLRRSLLTNDRSASTFSNHEQKKHKKRSKQERYRGMDNQEVDYEVVSGFFEDRNGKRRPVKLDRSRINTVKDYRHLYNDAVNSSSPNTDRRRKHRAKSLARSPIDEQQQQQFITPNFPLTNQPFMRPFGTSYLPFNTPFFPKQPFSTAPLFSRPNFINRLPLPHPSLWYRPM